MFMFYSISIWWKQELQCSSSTLHCLTEWVEVDIAKAKQRAFHLEWINDWLLKHTINSHLHYISGGALNHFKKYFFKLTTLF